MKKVLASTRKELSCNRKVEVRAEAEVSVVKAELAAANDREADLVTALEQASAEAKVGASARLLACVSMGHGATFQADERHPRTEP